MGEVIKPSATVSSTGWTLTGAATAHEALDEGVDSADDDTTKIGVTAINTPVEVNVQVGTNPNRTDGHHLKVRYHVTGAAPGDTADLEAEVKEGTTVVAAFQLPDIENEDWNTWDLDTVSLSIVDYAVLRLKLWYSKMPAGSTGELSAAELTIPDKRLKAHVCD